MIYLAQGLSVMYVCLWSSAALFHISARFSWPLSFSVLRMAPWSQPLRSPLFSSPPPGPRSRVTASLPTPLPDYRHSNIHPPPAASTGPHPSRGEGQSPGVTQRDLGCAASYTSDAWGWTLQTTAGGWLGVQDLRGTGRGRGYFGAWLI